MDNTTAYTELLMEHKPTTPPLMPSKRTNQVDKKSKALSKRLRALNFLEDFRAKKENEARRVKKRDEETLQTQLMKNEALEAHLKEGFLSLTKVDGSSVSARSLRFIANFQKPLREAKLLGDKQAEFLEKRCETSKAAFFEASLQLKQVEKLKEKIELEEAKQLDKKELKENDALSALKSAKSRMDDEQASNLNGPLS